MNEMFSDGSCELPTSIDNGDVMLPVEYDGRYLIGSSALFRCLHGYTFESGLNRIASTCAITNSAWRGDPICVWNNTDIEPCVSKLKF